MSGTPFTTGQLGKLQSIVSIGVTTALPKVAERFGDPKVVLKALEGRGEIFAGHLEGALEQAINRILILIPRDPMSLTVDKHHEPDAFYRTRSGEIYVWDEFRKRIVSKAKSTKEGTSFKVNVSELGQDATDEQIEGALAKNHLFDESAVCAIIAEMIGKQPNGSGRPDQQWLRQSVLHCILCRERALARGRPRVGSLRVASRRPQVVRWRSRPFSRQLTLANFVRRRRI